MNYQLIISKLNEINNKLDKLLCAEAVKPPVKKITIEQAEANKEFRFKCISEEQYNKYVNAVINLKTKRKTIVNMISRFNMHLAKLDKNDLKYEDLINLNNENYKLNLDIIINSWEIVISSKRTLLGALVRSIRIIYDNIDNLEQVISRIEYYYKMRLLEIQHNQRPDVLPPKTEAKPVENIEPEAIGFEFINREVIF